jgi:CheY-like chemotaxis protein
MPTGEFVAISVEDTGSGIPDEVLEHVLEPFFTTKPGGKGTGLGLATVYGIVKKPGGYLQIDTEVGTGTKITAYLPRSLDGVEVPAGENGTGSSARGTILVVEDDDRVRRVAADMLEEQGHTVLAASSGAIALEVLAGRNGAVDLLLTDMVMPGMSGRQLADRAVARFPNLNVLFMSGYTDDTILKERIEKGGADMVRKPFTPASLGRAVLTGMTSHDR